MNEPLATLEEVIERSKGRCDWAEVYYVSRNTTPVEFENNRLKRINTSDHEGVAIRVVVNGRMGFSTTTRLEALHEVLEYAVASAAYGDPAGFEPPDGAVRGTNVQVHDPQVPALPVERMVEMGQTLLDPIHRLDPAIQAFSGVEKEEGRVVILNTKGFYGEYRATGFGIWAGGELVEGDNMLWVYDGYGRCNLGDVEADILDMARDVVRHFELGRTNVPFRSGRYPVIFSPRALTDLLRPILACLDGKAVEKGLSPWRGRLGHATVSPLITLEDDATIPYAPHTFPFDGEGTPSQRTPLITEGHVANFYLDRRTAVRLGRTPTGNGLRSLTSPPAPSPTNVILAPGSQSIVELMSSIREGVFIESLMGAWAGNPYSGEVSGNISLGYLIESGQPKGRIKDCLFAANAFEAFRDQVLALSKERKWVGAEFLPYALFDGISISTR